MKWTDELEAVLEVMFQARSLRGADEIRLPRRKRPINFMKKRNGEQRNLKKHCHLRLLAEEPLELHVM